MNLRLDVLDNATVECGQEPLEGNYFVAAYPPFSCWNQSHVGQLRRVLNRRGDRSKKFGIYVHIPFCVERCAYCYYMSHADRGGEIRPYLDALTEELSTYARMPALAGRKPDFVYFGGGTPSMLSTPRIDRLIRGLRTSFPWTEAREVTFECAPKSVTVEKMRLLRALGVTRLSLGVQQLDDRILKLNGRVHLTEDVLRAYQIIRNAGFDVVNVDLIVGLVGETEQTFERSLSRVIDLAPDSVTLYQLEIPRNTKLAHQLREQTLSDPIPSWPTKNARLTAAFEQLARGGYHQQSAYTMVRDPQKHRFRYMGEQYRGADLIGIGASSFGYVDGVHYQNAGRLNEYMNRINDDDLPVDRAYALAKYDQVVREFVLQLKLGELDLEYFQKKFDVNAKRLFAEPLQQLAAHGRLHFDGQTVRLSTSGLVQIDRLIPAFYPLAHQRVDYW